VKKWKLLVLLIATIADGDNGLPEFIHSFVPATG